jgi:hypothetical protein
VNNEPNLVSDPTGKKQLNTHFDRKENSRSYIVPNKFAATFDYFPRKDSDYIVDNILPILIKGADAVYANILKAYDHPLSSGATLYKVINKFFLGESSRRRIGHVNLYGTHWGEIVSMARRLARYLHGRTFYRSMQFSVPNNPDRVAEADLKDMTTLLYGEWWEFKTNVEKAGVLYHEASHLFLGTEDHGYWSQGGFYVKLTFLKEGILEEKTALSTEEKIHNASTWEQVFLEFAKKS